MKKSDSANPRELVQYLLIAGMIVMIILLTAIFVEIQGLRADLTQGSNTPAAAIQNNQGNLILHQSADITNVSIAGDPIRGNPSAKVTIIEFSDFQCPYCIQFFNQTLSQIEDKYVYSGKVRLIFKNYPLPIHENAQKAAEAAECAKQQKRFWEMHDLLFTQGVMGGVDSYKKYAAMLKLNTTQFNECLDSGLMAPSVAADKADGAAIGVTGTPSFVIDGKLVVGAQPYENFAQMIDAALAK